MQPQIDSRQQCNCCLCRKKDYLITNSNKMKMTNLCVLILKALEQLKPEKDFYSMKLDIIDFIGEHWFILHNFPLFQRGNWKKMLLDTFNHCVGIETGKKFNLRASFRLKKEEILEVTTVSSSPSVSSKSETIICPVMSPSFITGNIEKVLVQQELYSSLSQLQNLLNQNVLLLSSYCVSHGTDNGQLIPFIYSQKNSICRINNFIMGLSYVDCIDWTVSN